MLSDKDKTDSIDYSATIKKRCPYCDKNRTLNVKDVLPNYEFKCKYCGVTVFVYESDFIKK